MFGISLARLAWLGRWPRRIAALICLLLAAASALSTQPTRRDPATPTDVAASANPLTDRLSADQVAAAVSLPAGTTAYLRVGDRIDLYATDTSGRDCVSSGDPPAGIELPVLAVPDPRSGSAADGDIDLVVAVDRPTAARLAALRGCGMFAVLDKHP